MPKHITKPFNLVNESVPVPVHQADVLIQVAILDATLSLFNKTQSSELLTGLKADCVELVKLIEQTSKQPKKAPKPLLKSRFNVINRSRHTLAKNISFDKAEQLKKQSKTECFIKFAGMEAVQ